VLSSSHQRGKKQKNQKNKTENIPSSNAVEFQEVFQHAVVVQLLSHPRKRKRKKKKKKDLETVL
jgi:hypothetical protein